MYKHTPGPWSVEVLDTTTNIEAKYQTVATDVSNCDADLIAAAPDMLRILANITRSAPIIGLPLALEKDIQDACKLLTRLREGK